MAYLRHITPVIVILAPPFSMLATGQVLGVPLPLAERLAWDTALFAVAYAAWVASGHPLQ